jgi:hypothetical protein
MTFSLQQLGNFPQFWKDELANALYVAWIGFYGACMIILLQFKKTPEKLDTILPTQLPTTFHPFVKPYAVTSESKSEMGMFKYLFSYDSDFPYNIKTDIEMIDGYFFFFGGMGSYLFSSIRYVLKSMIEFVNVDNFFVDILCFYILPTVLFYIVLIPIIPFVSFFVINFISCFYQPRIQKAFIFAFAFIFNLMDYESIKSMLDLSQFPQGIIRYCMNVFIGFLMTFFFLPSVSGLYSLGVWVYVIAFVKLMPFFLVYVGGLSWGDFGSKLLEQYRKHFIGLTIILLFSTISIAYKNLDQRVALGTQIGIIVIILMLLKVFKFIQNLYLYFKGELTSIPNPFTDIMESEIEMQNITSKMK